MISQSIASFSTNPRELAETCYRLERLIAQINCEIFTLTIDLESALALEEKAIAFDSSLKNDAQRKATLGMKMIAHFILEKRQALTQGKQRKALLEARLNHAIRLYELGRDGK